MADSSGSQNLFKERKTLKSGTLGEMIPPDGSYIRPYAVLIFDDFISLKNVQDDWNEIAKVINELTEKYGIDTNSQEYGILCELRWLRKNQKYSSRELAMYLNYKALACLVEWIASTNEFSIGSVELNFMLRFFTTDNNQNADDLKKEALAYAENDEAAWDIFGDMPFSRKAISNKLDYFDKLINAPKTIKLEPIFLADALLYEKGSFYIAKNLLQKTEFVNWDKDQPFIEKWEKTISKILKEHNYIKGNSFLFPHPLHPPDIAE